MYLSTRTTRLRVTVLACLLASWPFCAGAQAAPETKAHTAASRSASADTGQEALQQWFAEQDKILDEILARLARIEILVNDIHRLVAGLPNQASSTEPSRPAPPAVPPSPRPAAVPTPVAVEPVSSPPPAENLADTLSAWAPQLAGGVLLLLLLLWWQRRRNAAPSTGPATSSLKPDGTAPEQPAAKPARPAAEIPAGPPAAQPGISVDIDLNLGSDQSEQALELADIMLSMGLGHGAAQTLAEQIRSEPKQALRHWLKLLEVYRRNGQQAEFERSAEELRLHFNVKPEDWQAPPDTQHSVEDYPHITARLTELWGRPACLVYLQNLLADNRGGARSGFPQPVAEDLLLLTAMLRSEGLMS